MNKNLYLSVQASEMSLENESFDSLDTRIRNDDVRHGQSGFFQNFQAISVQKNNNHLPVLTKGLYLFVQAHKMGFQCKVWIH